MDKKNNTKIAIVSTISKLKIGESAVFPMARTNAVRNTCSSRSLDLGMTWSTSLDSSTHSATTEQCRPCRIYPSRLWTD